MFRRVFLKMLGVLPFAGTVSVEKTIRAGFELPELRFTVGKIPATKNLHAHLWVGEDRTWARFIIWERGSGEFCHRWVWRNYERGINLAGVEAEIVKVSKWLPSMWVCYERGCSFVTERLIEATPNFNWMTADGYYSSFLTMEQRARMIQATQQVCSGAPIDYSNPVVADRIVNAVLENSGE